MVIQLHEISCCHLLGFVNRDQFLVEHGSSLSKLKLILPLCRSRTWPWKSLAHTASANPAQAQALTREARDLTRTLIPFLKGYLIRSLDLQAPTPQQHGTLQVVLTIIPVDPTQGSVEHSVATAALGESHSQDSHAMWCWRMMMSPRSGWPMLNLEFISHLCRFPKEEMTLNGFVSGSKYLYCLECTLSFYYNALGTHQWCSFWHFNFWEIESIGSKLLELSVDLLMLCVFLGNNSALFLSAL